MEYLEFIETPTFSCLRKDLMKDDDFQKFQSYLLEHHEKGDTISHTGGCKKIRWGREGMGKRGGVRIIYFVRNLSGRIYLLLIYPKNCMEDLTQEQKAEMKNIVQKLK
ncbi:type II toxin-antitoxin system RelE/ParE family toxin [Salmonella enterica subsp. diarizonae serovar 42:l,v:1,5,7]|uniref:Type II toxin-antitoxin system RelE/ParE family toxin n=1 Tax=Salmonella diarizonae TaxID=59204 RepID=A0A6Y1QRP3_SALDZ|nr:type II toxin-antitoxin system RelE/ParE family toxin [Salmonella enterica]EBE3721492.1 type II toxin-antitoxin system RelE/ParE family toxin [Salmonella enterica subsp. diarizonae serovar 42:l,v:1,5,7]EBW7177848.1 type II toxin-antitoxin system RelE/ParE family toxin [Salmonella enterica subsp. enterica serovar Weltevreden]ECJ4666508.1 type II toxin-antitoxin system RelE/ParE family toxin [Salmonella enterica subsp. diarizonae]ECJ5923753.1 type II toxin-antitoxin system RelE/ParE family tox